MKNIGHQYLAFMRFSPHRPAGAIVAQGESESSAQLGAARRNSHIKLNEL